MYFACWAKNTEINRLMFFCHSLSASKLENLIKLLLSRGADPNVSPLPLQAMFYAVLVGEVELVKDLLKSGAKSQECLPNEVT